MYSYIEDRCMRTSYTTIHLKHTHTYTQIPKLQIIRVQVFK